VSAALDYEDRPAIAELAEIDREILRLVAAGRTSKEIARALGRSHYTIDDRIKDVCRTLGADNRGHAAVMLLREEALTPPPDLGGAPPGGLEARPGRLAHAGEDSGSHQRRRLRALTDGLMDPRLGRLAIRLSVILVGIAMAAFLLASAITAVQGVFLTVLRG